MAAAGEQALAARPLVAVLDLRRRLAYWSNITEEHAGRVFKVRLSDAYRGSGWPPELLSARERRTLAVGPIRSHESALHARYSELSDLGTTRPDPAGSRSTRWLEAEHELLLVEYEVIGARACQIPLSRPRSPQRPMCLLRAPPPWAQGEAPSPLGRYSEAAVAP